MKHEMDKDNEKQKRNNLIQDLNPDPLNYRDNTQPIELMRPQDFKNSLINKFLIN